MPDEAAKTRPLGAQAIKDALANVPRSPGVYLMKDARGRVIYVGKAKVLRNRLSSYTRQEPHPNYYRQKVQAMVAKVAAVEYVVTSSEKEALLLENTLIKRHGPRYNVDLRDDKTYPMFRLSVQHEFPRLSLVRRPGKDGARYFGPFESAGAARKTMRLLQRIFPLRRCSDHTLKNRSRPCLDYDTGHCTAPCTGLIGRDEYRDLVRQVEAFFSGQGKKVAAGLKRRMQEASRQQNYEQAAALRDRWQALERTLEGQRVSKTHGGDVDALALHDEGGAYRLAHLKVRQGRVVATLVHDLSRAAMAPEDVLGQAALAIYEREAPPPLLLVSHMPSDPGLVAEVLGERAGRRVELRKPARGEKLGLLNLAMLNAAQAREAGERPEVQALERLGRKLGMNEPPVTMECVDISHLGGNLTVASVVAFKEGRPDKSNYRRYKLVGLDGMPDDFAAMAEVVGRRLAKDRPAPDLLVVDGGKGQLGVALAAMEEVPQENRPVLAALAKGKKEDEPDRIFLPGRKNPLNLKAHDPALLLAMRLRDEAHRFAISYHRLLRSKALRRSILEEVPGVGPKRAQRILAAFKSLAALKKAGAGEIAQKAGLDRDCAAKVAAFLAALDSQKPRE